MLLLLLLCRSTCVDVAYFTEGVAWTVGLSVCSSVCLSVCLDREPCKTAEPSKMPIRMWTWVSARKHALDGAHIGATF